MRTGTICCGLLFIVVATVSAEEQPLILTISKPRHSVAPNCPVPCPPQTIDPKLGDPKLDLMPKDDPNAPRAPDTFAGAGEAGTQPSAQFNPNVFGDLIGVSACRVVTIPGQFNNQQIIIPPRFVTGSNQSPGGGGGGPGGGLSSNFAFFVPGRTINLRIPATTVAKLPLPGRYAGVKVSDNESPRPTNRLYFTYNNFADVNRSLNDSGIPAISQQQQVLGFERTFLQGDASFGMRLPFVQVNGFAAAESHIVGDISFLSKFAWINDRETGNVLSTGLIITAPTGGGDDFYMMDGEQPPHSTLFQPWGGFIYNFSRSFVQGFSSVIIPTDDRDPTIMFNSIAAGYWLYRNFDDRLVNGIVPVMEMHLNTPLTNRDGDCNSVFFQDQLNITGGLYMIFPRMTIGGAVAIPVMGPRPFDVEGIGSLNFRF